MSDRNNLIVRVLTHKIKKKIKESLHTKLKRKLNLKNSGIMQLYHTIPGDQIMK